jgi:hypothetical protein
MPTDAADRREDSSEEQRDETRAERMDRNWTELLQELRVAQTGVQVLSGLLLTVPFQQRFLHLTTGQQRVYLTAFLLATVSTGLLVAPVSTHRMLFRKHEKDVLVGLSDVLAKLGLATLALTVTAVVFLIFSVVLGTAPAIVAAASVLVVFAGGWVVLPLVVLHRATRSDSAGPAGGKRRP